MTPARCPQSGELYPYLHLEQSRPARRRTHEHLAACARCRAELIRLKALRDELERAVPALDDAGADALLVRVLQAASRPAAPEPLPEALPWWRRPLVRTPAWTLAAVPALTLVALVAAALVWRLWPAGAPGALALTPLADARAPGALAHQLDGELQLRLPPLASGAGEGLLRVVPEPGSQLALEHDGHELALHLSAGQAAVRFDNPGQARRLWVQSAWGQVAVVGTTFAVRASGQGLAVTVGTGAVLVLGADSRSHEVRAGQTLALRVEQGELRVEAAPAEDEQLAALDALLAPLFSGPGARRVDLPAALLAPPPPRPPPAHAGHDPARRTPDAASSSSPERPGPGRPRATDDTMGPWLERARQLATQERHERAQDLLASILTHLDAAPAGDQAAVATREQVRAEARLLLAQSLLRQGRDAEAGAQLALAAQTGPQELAGLAHLELGRLALRRLDRPAEARRHLLRFLAVPRPADLDEEARLLLCESYLAAWELDDARACLKTAERRLTLPGSRQRLQELLQQLP